MEKKLVELNIDQSILVSSSILNYEKPDVVYLPLKENSKILVHQHDFVKIGTPIIKEEGHIISSPISGKVEKIKNVETITGEAAAIEILNDFKETKEIDTKSKRTLSEVKKERMEEVFNKFHISLVNCKNLVLNCVDDEPYVVSESFYLYLNHEEFLELLDELDKRYHFNSITIAIKSHHSINITKLMDNLGMYPNISLNVLPNLYLLGKESFLRSHLGLESIDTCVIKASTFYHIHNEIKMNKSITDELITISGNNILNPHVVKVKLGSKLKEVVASLIETKDDSIYFGNGLMQGEKIDLDNFIITSDFNSLLIMKKEAKKEEEKCLNCGACIDICPVQLNPILLKKEGYRKKTVDTCLKCGLCTYICPANINFNKEIKGDANE